MNYPEKMWLLLYLPSLPTFFSMPKDNYLDENVSLKQWGAQRMPNDNNDDFLLSAPNIFNSRTFLSTESTPQEKIYCSSTSPPSSPSSPCRMTVT